MRANPSFIKLYSNVSFKEIIPTFQKLSFHTEETSRKNSENIETHCFHRNFVIWPFRLKMGHFEFYPSTARCNIHFVCAQLILKFKGSNVIPGRQQSISNASACNLFSYEKFSFQGNPRWFSFLNWCIADVIVIVTVWVAVSERGFAIPSVSEANIWQPTQWDLCCTSLNLNLNYECI